MATLEDPGDLAPAGIGTRGATLHVQRLRVLRDVYYVATDGHSLTNIGSVYGPEDILKILNDPTTWEETQVV